MEREAILTVRHMIREAALMANREAIFAANMVASGSSKPYKTQEGNATAMVTMKDDGTIETTFFINNEISTMKNIVAMIQAHMEKIVATY